MAHSKIIQEMFNKVIISQKYPGLENKVYDNHIYRISFLVHVNR